VAVVGKLVQKQENRQLYTKGETMYKTIQKQRINKTENKSTKTENKYKKNVKKHNSII
jgi:hypothetical protein